jgi:hypothetical protein
MQEMQGNRRLQGGGGVHGTIVGGGWRMAGRLEEYECPVLSTGRLFVSVSVFVVSCFCNTSKPLVSEGRDERLPAICIARNWPLWTIGSGPEGMRAIHL